MKHLDLRSYLLRDQVENGWFSAPCRPLEGLCWCLLVWLKLARLALLRVGLAYPKKENVQREVATPYLHEEASLLF